MDTGMEVRKREEIEFHNMLREGAPEQRWSLEDEERLRSNPLWSNFKYYSVERKSIDLVENFLRKRAPGKRVLDFCCGNGDDTVKMARMGAREAIGIDISDAGIEHGKRRAMAEGVQSTTRFLVMDAEAMTFEDSYFDLIKVYGCLHHLDLKRAYSELSRVLKPDGQIICTEALGHNPVIQLYRSVTPHLRTAYEAKHLLKRRDLALAEEYFDDVSPRFFHLATLFAVPFRKIPGFGALLSTLEAIDSALLMLPGLRWMAWHVVFTLGRPRKKVGVSESNRKNPRS